MWHIWVTHLFLIKCSSETNLELVTELLRVRNKATIRIPFVEPRAAADLRRLLLPVDRSPYAVVELHVITSSICTYDHIFWVWLDWKNKKPTETLQQLTRSLCSILSGYKQGQIIRCSVGSYLSYKSPPGEVSQWYWKEARHSLIPLACSRTSEAEQAHRCYSCMASWDQQALSLQQCWLEVEMLESAWEEAEERRKTSRL